MKPTKICTLQARLARTQDRLRRKLIDEVVLRPISLPIDTIRMKTRVDYQGTEKGLIYEKADVIPVVFPALTKVPFRKIRVNEETNSWELTSLIESFSEGQQEEKYTCQVPYSCDVDKGDMFFRIFIDEDIACPIIIPIMVTELLGTFGSQRLIMQEVNCTIPTFDIPQEVVDVIHEMATRRLRIGY